MNELRGTYFIKHPFIAMREDDSNGWVISRIVINPDTSMTLTVVGTAFDKTEAELKMEESDNQDKSDDGFESDEIATNNYGLKEPVYYV